MSDDQMPTWAQAMEARAESRNHHLPTEITKALADLETRLAHRIGANADRALNDTVVAMDVADRAERAVKDMRDDLGAQSKELRQFWRHLAALEQHVYGGGSKPPAAA